MGFGQKIYDLYQKYKDKCFLQDLSINHQLNKIAEANADNQAYDQRQAELNVFTKDSVPNLYCWYSMENEYITRDSGDNVSGIVDRSDSGYHLDTTPATKPIWYASVVNGKPAIYGNRNTYICKSGLATLSDYTLFIVLKPTDIGTANNDVFLSLTQGGFKVVRKNQGNTAIYMRSEDNHSFTGENLLTNRTDLLTFVSNDSNSSIRRNSNSAVNGDAGRMDSTYLILLNYTSSSYTYAYAGYIAEVLIYSSALSNANQEIVRNYLNDKYHIY